MGRLPAVIWGALALAGCPDRQDATKTVRDRSEAVSAGASSNAGAGASSNAGAGARPSAKSAAPRAICTQKPTGRAPNAKIDTMAAPSSPAPVTPIPFGAGKWIWLNFWAAWCGPCKEEMPRLLRWERELRKRGVLIDLAFVSLDDDDRELSRFLAAQPEGGVRASYRLRSDQRRAWLGALGIAKDAVLPVHALVSPKGELSCLIDGALEEGDYPALLAFLRSK